MISAGVEPSGSRYKGRTRECSSFRWITLALACALVLPACGSEGAAGPGGELGAALDGLCEARQLAERGLVGDAETAFQDRAHAYLHELAREAARTDRKAAARLLEAKQLVEQALAEPAEPRILARLLDDLRERTAEAAGTSPPECA
jgi:hypothetical protein